MIPNNPVNNTLWHSDSPREKKTRYPADYLYPFESQVRPGGQASPPQHGRGLGFTESPERMFAFPDSQQRQVDGLMKDKSRWSKGKLEYEEQASAKQHQVYDDRRVGAGGDVVLGMWTCCNSPDQTAPPCKTWDAHSNQVAKCLHCALYFDAQNVNSNAACTYHKGKPVPKSAYGGFTWDCCQHQTLNQTKYDGKSHLRMGCRRGFHLSIVPLNNSSLCTRCGQNKNDVKECASHLGLFCPFKRVRKVVSHTARSSVKQFYPKPSNTPVQPVCPKLYENLGGRNPNPLKLQRTPKAPVRAIIYPLLPPISDFIQWTTRTILRTPQSIPAQAVTRKMEIAQIIPPLIHAQVSNQHFAEYEYMVPLGGPVPDAVQPIARMILPEQAFLPEALEVFNATSPHSMPPIVEAMIFNPSIYWHPTPVPNNIITYAPINTEAVTFASPPLDCNQPLDDGFLSVTFGSVFMDSSKQAKRDDMSLWLVVPRPIQVTLPPDREKRRHSQTKYVGSMGKGPIKRMVLIPDVLEDPTPQMTDTALSDWFTELNVYSSTSIPIQPSPVCPLTTKGTDPSLTHLGIKIIPNLSKELLFSSIIDEPEALDSTCWEIPFAPRPRIPVVNSNVAQPLVHPLPMPKFDDITKRFTGYMYSGRGDLAVTPPAAISWRDSKERPSKSTSSKSSRKPSPNTKDVQWHNDHNYLHPAQHTSSRKSPMLEKKAESPTKNSSPANTGRRTSYSTNEFAVDHLREISYGVSKTDSVREPQSTKQRTSVGPETDDQEITKEDSSKSNGFVRKFYSPGRLDREKDEIVINMAFGSQTSSQSDDPSSSSTYDRSARSNPGTQDQRRRSAPQAQVQQPPKVSVDWHDSDQPVEHFKDSLFASSSVPVKLGETRSGMHGRQRPQSSPLKRPDQSWLSHQNTKQKEVAARPDQAESRNQNMEKREVFVRPDQQRSRNQNLEKREVFTQTSIVLVDPSPQYAPVPSKRQPPKARPFQQTSQNPAMPNHKQHPNSSVPLQIDYNSQVYINHEDLLPGKSRHQNSSKKGQRTSHNQRPESPTCDVLDPVLLNPLQGAHFAQKYLEIIGGDDFELLALNFHQESMENNHRRQRSINQDNRVPKQPKNVRKVSSGSSGRRNSQKQNQRIAVKEQVANHTSESIFGHNKAPPESLTNNQAANNDFKATATLQWKDNANLNEGDFTGERSVTRQLDRDDVYVAASAQNVASFRSLSYGDHRKLRSDFRKSLSSAI